MKLGLGSFKTAVLLLIVIALAVIGFIVWQDTQSTDDSSASTVTENEQKIATSKTYTDPAGLYTVTYPATWRLTKSTTGSGVTQTTDSSVMHLSYPGAPADALAAIGATKGEANIQKTVTLWQQQGMEVADTAINGLPAKYAKLSVQSEDQEILEHHYVLEHKGTTFSASFREKYQTNLTTPVKWEASKEYEQFMKIVNSAELL